MPSGSYRAPGRFTNGGGAFVAGAGAGFAAGAFVTGGGGALGERALPFGEAALLPLLASRTGGTRFCASFWPLRAANHHHRAIAAMAAIATNR